MLAANVRFRFGELDLVMRDDDTVVFVEVRYRSGSGFGDGADSVDLRKCRRMARAAAAWLAARPALAQRPARFDVLSASGHASAPDFDWRRDAFRLDDLGALRG